MTLQYGNCPQLRSVKFSRQITQHFGNGNFHQWNLPSIQNFCNCSSEYTPPIMGDDIISTGNLPRYVIDSYYQTILTMNHSRMSTIETMVFHLEKQFKPRGETVCYNNVFQIVFRMLVSGKKDLKTTSQSIMARAAWVSFTS